ncbi:MAG: hypothetical protein AAF636_11355 [Pseudomonadota bacterium]
MLLFAFTCSASENKTKFFEEITNGDGSILFYKFKVSKDSLLLIRIIGGEELEQAAGPIDPFAEPNKTESVNPIYTFFSIYGIEFSHHTDFAYDGEYLWIPNISQKEAHDISLVLKTLLDAADAHKKLITTRQNQAGDDNSE